MDDTDPVGYVVALPPESRTLAAGRARRGDFLPFGSGHWIAVSGAGIENATAAAAGLLDRGIRRLVSWGCAAALTDELVPGDLVLPHEVVLADGDRLSLASAWRSRLTAHLGPVLRLQSGSLAESAVMVASADEKRRLRDISGAVAADMETGAIARIARLNQLPCLAVRSIVDKASLTIPSAAQAALNADGEIAVSTLLSRLARHPGDLVPLIQLSTAFRAAMQTLRRVARHAGPSLDAQ